MTPYQAAVDLADQAIPSFPCLPSKAPMAARGFYDATLEHTPARWASAALVGVPTGEASGWNVLDVDVKSGGLDWLAAHEKDLPITRRVRTRSGGVHLYFRALAGLGCSVSRIAPGVDFRGEGGFIIHWPSAGQPTENEGMLAEPPKWLADAAAGGRTRHGADSDRDVSAPSVQAVVDILDKMPNADDNGRDVYLRVMMAARGCGDDPAIAEAAIRWADRWCGSPGADVETEKWERDFAHRDAPLAGWATLLATATRMGVDVSAERAAAICEFPVHEPVSGSPPLKRMRDRLIFPADCATGPRRGYLVKHLLAPGDVAAIIGAPGACKSQLAPLIAYAVAQGRPVFGLRTKPGRTLYLADEDLSGMRQRVHALRLQHGDAPDFALAECGSLTDPASVEDLLDAVADFRPALIVLDTVSATFAGMDENDAAGMGAVVALARRIAAGGVGVLLVHHTAKHGDGTPRGHSILNGTLDMCLRLDGADESDIVRGKLTKNRNGTLSLDLAFRSTVVTLSKDEDGDDITAPLAAELGSGQTARPTKLTPRESNALALLHELDGGNGVAEQAWRAACEDRRICTSDDSRNRAKVVSAVLRTLTEKNVVCATGDRLYIVEQHGTGRNSAGTDWNSHPAVPPVPGDRLEDLVA